MSSTRPLTLDVYEDPPHRSQEPAFLEAQEAMREAHEPAFLELRGIALRIAAERGSEGFTVDELMDAAGGRGRYPKNLPGVVLGNLRSKHAICVMGREKAKHPAAKGRWVNRFKLNSEAIRVDE
jgi:hypothetical protein